MPDVGRVALLALTAVWLSVCLEAGEVWDRMPSYSKDGFL